MNGRLSDFASRTTEIGRTTERIRFEAIFMAIIELDSRNEFLDDLLREWTAVDRGID